MTEKRLLTVTCPRSDCDEEFNIRFCNVRWLLINNRGTFGAEALLYGLINNEKRACDRTDCKEVMIGNAVMEEGYLIEQLIEKIDPDLVTEITI